MSRLSLIVPAWNEEENIRPFYDRVCDVFSDDDDAVEIVFVDDGSQDHTFEAITALHDSESRNISVKGISFSRNFGKEAAMLAGLRRAEGEYFSFIDADLQQDPYYVKKMVALLKANDDIDVVAAYQAERKENQMKRILKSGFYRVINHLSDVYFEPDASDFRTFRQSVRTAILSLTETNRFSKGIFSWIGFPTQYIPYQVKNRQHGSSSWSLSQLFHYAMDGIAGYSMAGLKVPFLLSGVSLAVSVLWLVFSMFLNGMTLVTLLPFLIFLAASIQMLALGCIGSYLGRAYTEIKRRPPYIIRRECGAERKEYDIINNTINIHDEDNWRKHA